jgi:hypothetical protein
MVEGVGGNDKGNDGVEINDDGGGVAVVLSDSGSIFAEVTVAGDDADDVIEDSDTVVELCKYKTNKKQSKGSIRLRKF